MIPKTYKKIIIIAILAHSEIFDMSKKWERPRRCLCVTNVQLRGDSVVCVSPTSSCGATALQLQRNTPLKGNYLQT